MHTEIHKKIELPWKRSVVFCYGIGFILRTDSFKPALRRGRVPAGRLMPRKDRPIYWDGINDAMSLYSVG